MWSLWLNLTPHKPLGFHNNFTTHRKNARLQNNSSIWPRDEAGPGNWTENIFPCIFMFSRFNPVKAGTSVTLYWIRSNRDGSDNAAIESTSLDPNYRWLSSVSIQVRVSSDYCAIKSQCSVHFWFYILQFWHWPRDMYCNCNLTGCAWFIPGFCPISDIENSVRPSDSVSNIFTRHWSQMDLICFIQSREISSPRAVRPQDQERDLRSGQWVFQLHGEGGRHREDAAHQEHRPDGVAAALGPPDLPAQPGGHRGCAPQPDLHQPGRVPAPSDQVVQGGPVPAARGQPGAGRHQGRGQPQRAHHHPAQEHGRRGVQVHHRERVGHRDDGVIITGAQSGTELWDNIRNWRPGHSSLSTVSKAQTLSQSQSQTLICSISCFPERHSYFNFDWFRQIHISQ